MCHAVLHLKCLNTNPEYRMSQKLFRFLVHNSSFIRNTKRFLLNALFMLISAYSQWQRSLKMFLNFYEHRVLRPYVLTVIFRLHICVDTPLVYFYCSKNNVWELCICSYEWTSVFRYRRFPTLCPYDLIY